MSNRLQCAARMRFQAFVGLFARYLLVATGVAAAGCGAGNASPTPGKIGLQFVSMSESEVIARLENGSDQPIYIMGDRTLSRAIDVASSVVEIACNSSTGPAESVLFGFVDGPKQRFAELSPNSVAMVNIATRFPSQHKGSRCEMSLALKDGKIVGPIELRW